MNFKNDFDYEEFVRNTDFEDIFNNFVEIGFDLVKSDYF